MSPEEMEAIYDRVCPVNLKFRPNYESLLRITYASMVMSAIDNFMDEDEVGIVKDYVKRHWRAEYGSLEKFFQEVDQKVVEFLVPEGGTFDLETQKELFLTNLLKDVDQTEATVIYCLFYQIMEADGFAEERELGLIRSLLEHVQV